MLQEDLILTKDAKADPARKNPKFFDFWGKIYPYLVPPLTHKVRGGRRGGGNFRTSSPKQGRPENVSTQSQKLPKIKCTWFLDSAKGSAWTIISLPSSGREGWGGMGKDGFKHFQNFSCFKHVSALIPILPWPLLPRRKEGNSEISSRQRLWGDIKGTALLPKSSFSRNWLSKPEHAVNCAFRPLGWIE